MIVLILMRRISCTVMLACCAPGILAAAPLEIGTRLELFVDDYLIESMSGDVSQHLNRPEPQEVVLTTGAPWEGNTCAYYTIFRDGGRYRMYYRGSHFDEATRRNRRIVRSRAMQRAMTASTGRNRTSDYSSLMAQGKTISSGTASARTVLSRSRTKTPLVQPKRSTRASLAGDRKVSEVCISFSRRTAFIGS